jgi:hypothetical protein
MPAAMDVPLLPSPASPGDDPVPAALAALVEILTQFPDLPVLESTGQLKGRAQREFPDHTRQRWRRPLTRICGAPLVDLRPGP